MTQIVLRSTQPRNFRRIDPQPHPSFIEVFGAAAVDDGNRTVEGPGRMADR